MTAPLGLLNSYPKVLKTYRTTKNNVYETFTGI